jgi:hypothetical protein
MPEQVDSEGYMIVLEASTAVGKLAENSNAM